MSYPDQPGGSYPPRDGRDHTETQYPPPPGEEDERMRAYHARAPSSNVTLPSISPYEAQQYGAPPNGYPADPRYRGDPYTDQQQHYRDERGFSAEYSRPPPPPQQQHMSFTQSAPRQRTAIACRYCRRRKIRCSGFDQSPEGRCSNCQRFQQECIFTPVSSQAQAFVPAHAAYPHMRNMAVGPDGRPRPVYPQGQLYGAHGQPLGPLPPHQNSSPYSDQRLPSPTGGYNVYPDDRGDGSRKRPQGEPHGSVLPPPLPQPSYGRPGDRRSAAEEDLRLPPVSQAGSSYSPGSSTSSTSLVPPSQSLPSLSRTPPPRSSPSERPRDPMSLGNIMEKAPISGDDIDRNMLGRLDRKH